MRERKREKEEGERKRGDGEKSRPRSKSKELGLSEGCLNNPRRKAYENRLILSICISGIQTLTYSGH